MIFYANTAIFLKVSGAFPNEEYVLALITSVAIDKSEKTYAYPIYIFFDENCLENNKNEPKLLKNIRNFLVTQTH